MKTVTLCGSMRFANEMHAIAFYLETEHGFNVLQCIYDPEGVELTDDMLEKLSAAHYAKIDLSDSVYVVNIGGYVGPAVRAEIDYAMQHGKEVLYHTDFDLQL